ncbi:hypothetical protein KO465_05300 [Candidatus Micrarchaeota archaeon]|nr:hypothetical protein [Candidatus Micrarchaeota archaeon]
MNKPIFLQNLEVQEIFQEIKKSIPKKSQLFLVGGTMRNTVFYYFFKTKLVQRDYDLIFIGDRKKFVDNLKKLRFTYGKIRRKNQMVLKKAIKENSKDINDFVVLDIYFSEKQNIYELLKNKINFTINGFALNFEHLFENNWIKNIIKLPYSIEDIKAKQLRLNTEKTNFFGTDIYACIRFISAGFKKPTEKEIHILYDQMRKLPKYKFERNKKKVFDYVGGKEKAEKIVKKMGLNQDIFSFETIQELRRKN